MKQKRRAHALNMMTNPQGTCQSKKEQLMNDEHISSVRVIVWLDCLKNGVNDVFKGLSLDTPWLSIVGSSWVRGCGVVRVGEGWVRVWVWRG